MLLDLTKSYKINVQIYLLVRTELCLQLNLQIMVSYTHPSPRRTYYFDLTGLGMNLLKIANYTIYSALQRRQLFFLSLYEYDSQKNELSRHGFQNWVETHFSLKQADTCCFQLFGVWYANKKTRCYDDWEQSDSTIEHW